MAGSAKTPWPRLRQNGRYCDRGAGAERLRSGAVTRAGRVGWARWLGLLRALAASAAGVGWACWGRWLGARTDRVGWACRRVGWGRWLRGRSAGGVGREPLCGLASAGGASAGATAARVLVAASGGGSPAGVRVPGRLRGPGVSRSVRGGSRPVCVCRPAVSCSPSPRPLAGALPRRCALR